MFRDKKQKSVRAINRLAVLHQVRNARQGVTLVIPSGITLLLEDIGDADREGGILAGMADKDVDRLGSRRLHESALRSGQAKTILYQPRAPSMTDPGQGRLET